MRRRAITLGRWAPRLAAGRAFTLIELLVVVAIIALLIALLLPSMKTARTQARIVRAHAELRQIDTALQMYLDAGKDKLPPSRVSCSLRQEYELPLELGEQGLLPTREEFVQTSFGSGWLLKVKMPDIFQPGETYKYRAPGAGIVNDTILEPYYVRLWVPDEFPTVKSLKGRYYRNDPTDAAPFLSPVRYATWSMGPDPKSPKFRDPNMPLGRAPVPEAFWCKRATDTGFITHFLGRDGKLYKSP